MISLPRLKLMLNVTVTTYDLLLAELLPAAVAIVQTRTNRYFSLPVNTTEYWVGFCTRNLYLRSIPYAGEVADDIDVVEQTAPGLNVVTITAANADGFVLRTGPRSAWLTRSGGYWWRDGFEYVVQYLHGYDEDTLPPDIEQVIVALIRRRLDAIIAGEMKSQTFDNYSYTRFGDADLATLNDHLQGVLDSWREPVMA